MWRGKLKYLTLWLFLAGVLLIVFLQFRSGESINRLIQGNKTLLSEVKVQNEIRKLESDVLTVESDIRGLVITADSSMLPAIQSKLATLENGSAVLGTMIRQGNTSGNLALLDSLVKQKAAFSRAVLTAYRTNGKAAGESLINTSRGQVIRDSILQVVSGLDAHRQENLHQVIGSTEGNGNGARTWGFILGAMAGIACLLAFLHVLNIGRHQQQMIVKLNESEKGSKEAARVKEQFLANMSHEIRTPMNAILGFTNLLKKTALDGQQSQYVDFIHSSGENLLTLINDILDLSKIEAGMMQLENAPFSLNGLISSVEIMFRDKAKSKGLQFIVQVDPVIHDTLSGDAIRLTQILINLLSNAIKFTEKGRVRLYVDAISTSDEDVVLRFNIQDTGIGILPEKMNNIFERFRQAEAETTRRFGGSGLGLSIVKQLVDLQRGSIKVESEPGKGTVFTVILPFKPVLNYELTHAVVPNDFHLTIKDAFVLIAEDNQMNQQLIHHLMKQWKIDYVLVNNGQEAIDELQQKNFSLVLMDIQMPVMDGYAATSIIRNDLKLSIPIVAMTAHAMAGEKEKCLSYGMNEYISKPIKERELYGIIEQYNAPEFPEHTQPRPDNIINLKYLRELSMGDAEFEHAIIRQFIVQVPEELELLREAIRQNNMVQVKSVAHGMKSSVAYMGLTDRLHPSLQRLESEAVMNSPVHFEEDFSTVEATCQQALAEAKQLQVYAA